MPIKLHKTVGVKVGPVQVGGGAPVAVQSMTNTDTPDVESTARQCIELAQAGSELVRITVNIPEAAAAVPAIKQRMLDAGVTAPLIGDFHYNGHLLLTKYPDCAKALDKYRINPGNVGTGKRRDEQFTTICKVAADNGKPVRIGVNGGSLNQELVMDKMQENTDRDLGKTSEEIINECMVLSALDSTALALESGLRKDQIIISCKVSRPLHLIAVYRELVEANRSAAAPRSHRGGHGHQRAGLVGVGDGRAAERRHRRHDSRLADAAAGRRSPRRSVRGVRDAAGARAAIVRAERDGLSRMRPDDEHHVPGARRAHAGLHSRDDAGVEGALRRRRRDDARRHGLRRQRSGRIESGEHRHQPAGHRRRAELPDLYRRPARDDAARHVRRARRRSSGRLSTITSRGNTRRLRPPAAPNEPSCRVRSA